MVVLVKGVDPVRPLFPVDKRFKRGFSLSDP